MNRHSRLDTASILARILNPRGFWLQIYLHTLGCENTGQHKQELHIIKVTQKAFLLHTVQDIFSNFHFVSPTAIREN